MAICQRVAMNKPLKNHLNFFNICFGKFENNLKEQWDLGSAEGGFISMNIGVSGIFRTLESILEHLVNNEYLDPKALGGGELADEVLLYLDPVIDFVNSLDAEGTKKLRSLFGSGATGRVQRKFQYAIHNSTLSIW